MCGSVLPEETNIVEFRDVTVFVTVEGYFWTSAEMGDSLKP
jgi:hypothetical protein